MLVIITIAIIAFGYLVLTTQLHLKSSRESDKGKEHVLSLSASELNPRQVFFFCLLATTLFFYLFSGGLLGELVLVPLLFFLFMLSL